ncbi:alpha/beta fold hydrolase [Kutzneria sp. NPDC052558]|uniref:alpha/beta fold hydrolase n=1 Tax=Kutzneria sp. NPDC052558 TaxID=3364121 RepID=UPI0037C9713A
MTTYVLVHGSTLGGWSFAALREELERRGHRVLAPSLTGLADRAHLAGPDTGLVLHIEDITRLLHWEDLHDVVLVGSSYGGMVITGVAGEVPERVRHLVYLDAFRPQPGQSCFDQLPDLPARLGDPMPEQPWAWPPFADYGPFGVTDPEQVAWLEAQSTPMPTLTHREPLPEPKHPVSTPATYVQGAAWRSFDEVAEQARRDGLDVHIWTGSGHLMYVTEAERVADLLVKI